MGGISWRGAREARTYTFSNSHMLDTSQCHSSVSCSAVSPPRDLCSVICSSPTITHHHHHVSQLVQRFVVRSSDSCPPSRTHARNGWGVEGGVYGLLAEGGLVGQQEEAPASPAPHAALVGVACAHQLPAGPFPRGHPL
jgi:hypothetical protein